MYFPSSTPSVSPVPAAEDAGNVPWLLIYGFIIILVLFFIYSAVRSLIYLYFDPPTINLFCWGPRDIESETSSEFSNRDGTEQRNIEELDVVEANTAVKHPIANQTPFNAVVSRFEILLRSILARFFQKKESKEPVVWHTGAHVV